ncbi:hypothetical protein WA158_001098 [Blastocystis sp. Blastoise]
MQMNRAASIEEVNPEELFPERTIEPYAQLDDEEQKKVEAYRQVLLSIQRSPYYVEVENNEWKIDRYSDIYNSNQSKVSLTSLYSYDVLSKYIPTELLGDKVTHKKSNLKLNLVAIKKLRELNETKENEEGEDDEKKKAEDGGDNLDVDVVYEDDENDNDYGQNYFDDDEGDDDDGGADDNEGDTY